MSHYKQDYHVGSGFPSLNFQIEDESESADSRAQLHSAYSSVCSAASTVASALSSLTSISFPSSSTTSFDFSNRLNFSMEAEQRQARKRRCETEIVYRNFDNMQHQITKKRAEQCEDCKETRGDIDYVHERPALEEYSVGSGYPFEHSHESTVDSFTFHYTNA